MRWQHIRRDWEHVRDEILVDAEAFGWLASALRGALGQEPLAVANDVELLVAILQGRCRECDEDTAEAHGPALSSTQAPATRRRHART